MPAVGIRMATLMAEMSSLPLMIWLSPAFPVGSFAYSHGLEWAVGAGAITGRTEAESWLRDLIAAGGLRNDAILLAAAWHATTAADASALARINDLALALAGSRERHLETSAQGNAFMLAMLAAWPHAGLQQARLAITGDIAYPVAVGIGAGAHELGLPATLQAFAVAGIGNLCSALVRLGAIGQTDAQRIMAALMADLVALAEAAAISTLDDLGGAAFGSDLAALAHETQDTRLFRS